MNIREELIYDFDLRRPHLICTDRLAVVDHVKRLLLLNETEIVVDCGGFFVSVQGQNLKIDSLEDQQMQMNGTVESIEFYRGKGIMDGR